MFTWSGGTYVMPSVPGEGGVRFAWTSGNACAGGVPFTEVKVTVPWTVMSDGVVEQAARSGNRAKGAARRRATRGSLAVMTHQALSGRSPTRVYRWSGATSHMDIGR